MQPFKQFTINNRTVLDNETIEFHYNFDEKEQFVERIIFPWAQLKSINTIDAYCSNIAIALWVSYYKLYPTKKIFISRKLNEVQEEFWHKFYKQWLGEFYYVNDIDPNWLAEISSEGDQVSNDTKVLPNKTLLLWWWGKDSIVSYELLKKQWEDITLFTFWKEYPIHKSTSNQTWEDRILIHRKLDIPQLKKLWEQWYYNWHVPITWIISFVSLLVCRLYWLNAVVTSNEQSANFWNTEWKWMTINHQRSKSFEFEKMFSDYAKNYVNPSIQYYSKLRNLFERQITEKFSHHKQYFEKFSSCNRNFHLDWRDPGSRRCCVCPKCLFVYIILRPFLTAKETMLIWWKELYEEEKLLSLAQELWWEKWIKPLECVWTIEESKQMTKLFVEKNKELATTMSVTKRFMDNIFH